MGTDCFGDGGRVVGGGIRSDLCVAGSGVRPRAWVEKFSRPIWRKRSIEDGDWVAWVSGAGLGSRGLDGGFWVEIWSVLDSSLCRAVDGEPLVEGGR